MSTIARTVGLVAAGVLAGGLVSGGLPALAQETVPSPQGSTTAPAVPGDGDRGPGRGGRDCPEEDGATGGAGGSSDGTPAAPAPSATSEV